MKKFKAILALVLVACLFVTLFAACAKNDETPNTNTNTNTNTGNDDANKDSGDADVNTGDDSLLPFEETVEIKVVLYDMRSTGADYGDPVEAAANEITKETINVVCDYIWVGPGDWKSKVDVALSGGERMDVLNISPITRASTLYPQGLLMDITEYVETYAPGAYELCKDYIGTYTFSGGIYGFPTIRDYCKFGAILMRTDILEELGMVEQALAIKTWSDYEVILDAVYQNVTAKGGMAVIGMSYPYADHMFCETDNFADAYPVDSLGDNLGVVYGNQDTGKVELIQTSKAYQFGMQKANEWWDKGYYWPDSGITTEFVDDAMKQNLFFTQILGAENGTEVAKEGNIGMELTYVQVNNGMIRTAQPVFSGVVVPITCEEPEAAVAWINEIYTNAELKNLLTWGVEGKDYTLENDQVKHNPDGGYLGVDFILGNNFLLKAEFGQSPDFYEVAERNNELAVKSRFMGFAIDTADMDLVISQISAVRDQYVSVIPYGGGDQLDDYLAKLEEAGVQEYIDAIQKQLDAWSAAQ